MKQRQKLTAFMQEFASAISAVVPSDVMVGVVGDWIVLATRYGLDGYETGFGLDDASDVKTIRGGLKGRCRRYRTS